VSSGVRRRPPRSRWRIVGGDRQRLRGADANDYILQARTWERHDVGTTKGFDGSVERALRSITVPVLYMPSATDLYFPLGDAEYERQFIAHVRFRAHSIALGPSGRRGRGAR